MNMVINLAEDIYPISDLQSQTEQLVKKVRTTKRPLVITEAGRSAIAILDIGEFQLLREQAALMADIYDIARAEQGPFIAHEEVKSRYSWLFEEPADAETTIMASCNWPSISLTTC
ncbi:MAG: type II toxin-antitoxin system Phd/YefM family antitoxin [Ardenticatenaceae bacterium]